MEIVEKGKEEERVDEEKKGGKENKIFGEKKLKTNKETIARKGRRGSRKREREKEDKIYEKKLKTKKKCEIEHVGNG